MIGLVDLADNSETKVSLDELRGMKLVNVWVETVNPSPEELEVISEKAGIPSDLLRLPESDNVVNLRLEPDYGVVNFLIVNDVVGVKSFSPLVLAFSKNLLVTIVREDGVKFSLVKERMSKVKIDPPSLVAYYILDEIVSGHFKHLELIEESTVTLEEEILGKAGEETLKKIFSLKSKLIGLNKILWYERGLLFDLKNCSAPWCPFKDRRLFDTTHEYLTRQIDIVETFREVLSDAVNAYLSTVSNKINFSIRNLTLVMFYLTIITTLTSFPNTVATFFGISQFGNTSVAIIFLAIVASTILPFIWLRRRRWLKVEG